MAAQKFMLQGENTPGLNSSCMRRVLCTLCSCYFREMKGHSSLRRHGSRHGPPLSHPGRHALCLSPRTSHRRRQMPSARQCLAPTDAMDFDLDQAVEHPTFKILYKDQDLVAIDKPQGFFVHPPEDGRPCPLNENGLWLLKKQLGGAWLYPLHRLDRATSGVTLYGLNRDVASEFGRMMRERIVRKTYIALCRGYTQTYGSIDLDVGGQASSTQYETLGRFQIPLKVGKWSQARYSLLRVEPLTGRFHQIRRHFNYISHPIVGDSDHGDRYHNRAFLNDLKLPGQYLRAASIEFPHPVTGKTIVISVNSWEERWQAVFRTLGQSPWVPPTTPHAAFSTPQEQDSRLEHLVRLSQQPLSELLSAQQQGTERMSDGKGAAGRTAAARLFNMHEQIPAILTQLPGPSVQ